MEGAVPCAQPPAEAVGARGTSSATRGSPSTRARTRTSTRPYRGRATAGCWEPAAPSVHGAPAYGATGRCGRPASGTPHGPTARVSHASWPRASPAAAAATRAPGPAAPPAHTPRQPAPPPPAAQRRQRRWRLRGAAAWPLACHPEPPRRLTAPGARAACAATAAPPGFSTRLVGTSHDTRAAAAPQRGLRVLWGRPGPGSGAPCNAAARAAAPTAAVLAHSCPELCEQPPVRPCRPPGRQGQQRQHSSHGSAPVIGHRGCGPVGVWVRVAWRVRPWAQVARRGG